MEQRERISRWMLAIGLWGCALWMARYGYAKEEFVWFVPALILGAIGTGRIFSDLLELGAKPFTAMVDAIIFPKVQGDKPPPNYKLVAYYLEEERWEDAEAEYRIILKNHRKETQAWLGLIRLLLTEGDKEEGKNVYEKARRQLRNRPDDLNDVEMAWYSLDK